MNAKPITLIIAVFLTTGTSHATNIAPSTIEQPVNLGAESDPARIPLGAVATESNYDYGLDEVITAPRPSLHGAMEWKSGIELNQNLASVFGIELSGGDLPRTPAVIRLRNFAKPAYSPYTKDQVLAATIHCMLRFFRGTPKAPIQLSITADSPEDEPLAKKYGGNYITGPESAEDPPVEPTPVPGTRLETDPRGIAWVVFPGITAKPATAPRLAVMIPFRLGGDYRIGTPIWKFLPVWTGGRKTREQSLEITGEPYPLFYDYFQAGRGDGPETNAIFAENPRGGFSNFNVSSDESSTRADLIYPTASPESLSAAILALVVSVQPTVKHPLVVALRIHDTSQLPWQKAFRTCPGWEFDKSAEDFRLSCVFVWDPETANLKRGGVPSAVIKRAADRRLYLQGSQQTRESERLTDLYWERFREQWQAGEFEPKQDHKQMPDTSIPMLREYWLSGYRDALLSFRIYQGSPLFGTRDPLDDPLWDPSYPLAMARHEGWTAGCDDGTLFAARILKEQRATLESSGQPESGKPANSPMPDPAP
jgi:hypothetical protein